MTGPITFTRGFSVGLFALIDAALPPVVAVGLLYGLCSLYAVEFKGFYLVLAVLAAVLSLFLPRGRATPLPLFAAGFALAMSVVTRWLVITAVLLAIAFVTKYSGDFSRRVVLTWVVATPGVLILLSLALQELMRRQLFDPALARRVAFAGCNEVSLSLAQRISSLGDTLGLHVEGFFDDRSEERLGMLGRMRLLGSLPDLVDHVKRHRIDIVFVALPVRHIRRVIAVLDELRDTTASVYYVPDILAADLIQARSSELFGIPIVALCETPFWGYRGVIKRITDIAFAMVLLTLASPLMLSLALGVWLSSPGPIFFRQRRYGLDGREIVVYKFRTMIVQEDGARIVQARRRDERVTRIGRFMRRYSLDELPQLINVLQGRMSLVGPRPHAVAHNEEYRKLIKGYMIRHKVPPGITGLAQVNGCRGETARVEDMQARVDYDLEYLRRWSPLLDVKILALTAIRLLRDEKAY